MALEKETLYTVEYIENLPEGHRAELIDGVVYDMAPPKRIHQKIVSFMNHVIYAHIAEKDIPCDIYPAPFGVYLDEYNFFEPDISVICDHDKLSDRGCEGAPDWIIEVVSPSTASNDYLRKLNKYQAAGVRLYWIVNPDTNVVSVYDFENGFSMQYVFADPIPVSICEGFQIRLADA